MIIGKKFIKNKNNEREGFFLPDTQTFLDMIPEGRFSVCVVPQDQHNGGRIKYSQ